MIYNEKFEIKLEYIIKDDDDDEIGKEKRRCEYKDLGNNLKSNKLNE